MTATRRLIVNADDLGRTPGINAGIFEAHARGLVTSASLMVTPGAAADVPALARAHPRLGIGLHVALTGGRTALPPEQVASLVDVEGRLPSKPEGLTRAQPGQVRAELRAQLTRFERLLGRRPTHFDSHHHAQRVPAVFTALVELARETGLPVRLASPEMAAPLREAGVATTDAFVERFFGDAARLETLLAIVGELSPGVTELMCHPARVDDELRASSSYAEARARELSILTCEAARAAVRAAGVELIHFGALERGR